MQVIEIPLKEYIELHVGTKQYAVVSISVAERIRQCSNCSQLCEIENTDGVYTDMFGATLRKLDPSLCRLWLRSTFDAAENGRRKRSLERVNCERYDNELKKLVAAKMSEQMKGVFSPEVCLGMLVNASRKTLEETLTTCGVVLPVIN